MICSVVRSTPMSFLICVFEDIWCSMAFVIFFFYILCVCASELCLHVGMAFFFERLNMVFLCEFRLASYCQRCLTVSSIILRRYLWSAISECVCHRVLFYPIC